ncbi:MAG TPA: hypothetical protein VHB21_16505 [Minicystis sp.]|nr:hypothetical protein [Minicystis sp.]
MSNADAGGRFARRVAPIALAAAVHLSVLGAAPAAFAQRATTTTSLVQRGSELFEDQQYEESIQTLSAALVRPGATTKEKIEIYRLLAYNYIILKRTDEADAAVRGILVLDENFTLPPSESPRFRDFFDAVKKKWEAEGKPGRAAPEQKPIKMQHTSPAEVPHGEAIKLSGTIEDPDARVRGVTLAYRTGAKGKFVTVAATYALGSFRTQIPASAVKPPLVEYYIQAMDKGGLPVASRGDAANPIRVVVPGSTSVLASPFFWVPVGLAAVGGAVVTVLLLTQTKTSHVTIGVRE